MDRHNSNRWNAWVATRPHAQFLQSWEWGTFQRSLGREVIPLSREYDGALSDCALAIRLPLWRGASSLYCPRGPIVQVAWYIERLKHVQGNALFIRYEPGEQDDGLARKSLRTRAIQPEIEWVLDLSPGYDRVQRHMHPKTRYNIRLAGKKGVHVRTVRSRTRMQDGDFEAFCRLLAETAGARRFRLHPKSYYRAFIESFLPHERRPDAHTPFAQISFAEYNGIALAATMTLFFGDTALYVHGGSARAHRDRMASYLLHDSAIRDAMAENYRYYNFGGIAPEGVFHHSLSGITRFKRGFGGESRMYSGTYDYPLRKAPYLLYTGARRVLRALSSFNG